MRKLITDNYELIHVLMKRRPHIKISTLHKYRSVYLKYLSYMKQGNPKQESIVWAADDFNISDRVVYQIIKLFEE